MSFDFVCPEHGPIHPGQVSFDGHRCTRCGRSLYLNTRQGYYPDEEQVRVRALMEERDHLLVRLADTHALTPGDLRRRELKAAAMELELAAADLDHRDSAALLRKRASDLRRAVDLTGEDDL